MDNGKNNQKLSLKELQKELKSKEMDLRMVFTSLTKREKDILYKTVKLTEEVGELSNEILSVLSLQRQSKLRKFDRNNLYEEFADIIISTMILANAMKVDVSRAVKGKMNKILTHYVKDRA
ncbi:MAG: MazG nucleotide pyrophosphohydrolase domain-containing protein [Patescibacteria group bacterium]